MKSRTSVNWVLTQLDMYRKHYMKSFIKKEEKDDQDKVKTSYELLDYLAKADAHSFIITYIDNTLIPLSLANPSMEAAQKRIIKKLQKSSFLKMHNDATDFQPFDIEDNNTGFQFKVWPVKHLQQSIRNQIQKNE